MRLFIAAMCAAAIQSSSLAAAPAGVAPTQWTLQQDGNGACAATIGFDEDTGASGYTGSVFLMRLTDLDHITDAFSFSPDEVASLPTLMRPGTSHQLRLVLMGNGTHLDLGPSRFVVSAPPTAPGALTLTGVRIQKEMANFRRFDTLKIYTGAVLIRSVDLQGSAPAFREQGKCIVLAMMRARGAG